MSDFRPYREREQLRAENISWTSALTSASVSFAFGSGFTLAQNNIYS